MKNFKKISVTILIILVFLIGVQSRASANSNEEILKSNLNIENLIKYINNLDLTEEEVANISEKSKAISKDIKEKASFKDYKLTEIIKIYRKFTSMSKSLKLNIDFSMKNGDFNLKDKSNNNSIFKGNISEIKTYFNAIKNNTELLATEVLANIDNEALKDLLETDIFNNIDNEALIESIEEVIYENSISYEKLKNNDNLVNNEEVKVIQNENKDEDNKEIYNNESNLSKKKSGSNIIITIFVLVLICFLSIISYIKFR